MQDRKVIWKSYHLNCFFFRQRKSLTLRKEDWCSSRGSRLWSIMRGRRNKWNYRRKCKKKNCWYSISWFLYFTVYKLNFRYCNWKKNIRPVSFPFKFVGVKCGTTFFMLYQDQYLMMYINLIVFFYLVKVQTFSINQD